MSGFAQQDIQITMPAPSGADRMSPHVRALLIVLLFLGALVARLPGLNNLPGDFVTPREYHTAMLARAMYLQQDAPAPAWEKEIASAQLDVAIKAEPPILAGASSFAYQLLGREVLAVPRSISITAWMFGGILLFFLFRKLAGFETAFVGAACFLFHPFGIGASRSLITDPLMIMGILASARVIVWYYDRPSIARYWVSVLVSAMAIIIKPGGGQFCILAVFLFLSIHTFGLRGSLCRPGFYVYPIIALLPSAAYAFLGPMRSAAAPLFNSFFMPGLMLTPYFWKGWVHVLFRTLGPATLLLGATGLLLCGRGRLGVVVASLAVGYLGECVLRTYTTASHDNWHLEALIVAALGVGRIGATVWSRLAGSDRALERTAVVTVSAVWLIVVTTQYVHESLSRASDDYPAIARQIGETVRHSTRTVFLDYNYGWPLCYFASISGRFWPDSTDLWADRVAGRSQITAVERYERFYKHDDPEYFIVCRRLNELNAQADLKDFLARNARLLAEHPRYIVYQFTNSLESASRSAMP